MIHQAAFFRLRVVFWLARLTVRRLGLALSLSPRLGFRVEDALIELLLARTPAAFDLVLRPELVRDELLRLLELRRDMLSDSSSDDSSTFSRLTSLLKLLRWPLALFS